MKLIRPIAITQAIVTANSAANADADYVSATSYAINALVTFDRRIYKSLQADNASHTPGVTESAAWWSDQGPSNKWAVFDSQVNTKTTAASPWSFTLTGVAVDSASLIGLDASIVRVVATKEGAPRTNLLTYSENFDNAVWVKEDISVSGSSVIAAPDGTMTTKTLTATVNGGPNTCYLSSASAVTVAAASTYTFSIFLQAGNVSTTVIDCYQTSPFQDNVGTITWGTTPTITASAGATNPLITSIGNGWYRASITLSTTTGTGLVTHVYTRSQGTANVIGDTAYVWGAQLEVGSSPTEYIPTTSSPVTTTTDTVYDKTTSMMDNSLIGTWGDYFFSERETISELALTDLPKIPGTAVAVTLTRNGGGSVSCGKFDCGSVLDVGLEQYGLKREGIDYTSVTFDPYSVVTIGPQRYVRKFSTQVLLENDRLDMITRRLDALASVPLVIIGANGRYTSMIVYGLLSYSLDLALPSYSYVSFDVKGLI